MWGWWPSCSVSLLLPLFVNTAWKPQAVEYQPPQKISDLGMMFNSSQIFNHTGKLKPKRCALSGLKNKLLLMVEVFFWVNYGSHRPKGRRAKRMNSYGSHSIILVDDGWWIGMSSSWIMRIPNRSRTLPTPLKVFLLPHVWYLYPRGMEHPCWWVVFGVQSWSL